MCPSFILSAACLPRLPLLPRASPLPSALFLREEWESPLVPALLPPHLLERSGWRLQTARFCLRLWGAVQPSRMPAPKGRPCSSTAAHQQPQQRLVQTRGSGDTEPISDLGVPIPHPSPQPGLAPSHPSLTSRRPWVCRRGQRSRG